jgi:hypothetical protein
MKKILIPLALLSGLAHAEFNDGNKLLSDLRESGYVVPSVALGYIMGVADVVRGTQWCPPENVTAGQIRDMVRNYLEAYPNIRHYTGDAIVIRVLSVNWPCAKKGSTL